MANENLIPKTEEVREIENKTPSYEEFMKNYKSDERVSDSYDSEINDYGDIGVSKGYGPCKNSLCGCSCSSSTCVCTNTEGSLFSKGSDQWGSFTAAGRKEGWQEGLSGDTSVSLYRCKGGTDDAKILSASAGTDISRTSVNVRAGVNLVDYKSDGVRVRVGINGDTGGGINSDGVEAKFLGFGASVGKKNGISTPLGGFSVDSDKCVIQ